MKFEVKEVHFSLDELRSLRVSAERAEEESAAARREGEERERRAGEAERRMKTVVKELDEVRRCTI